MAHKPWIAFFFPSDKFIFHTEIYDNRLQIELRVDFIKLSQKEVCYLIKEESLGPDTTDLVNAYPLDSGMHSLNNQDSTLFMTKGNARACGTEPLHIALGSYMAFTGIIILYIYR